MTTPERLRRRQRIELSGLIGLLVLGVISSILSDHRNDQQDACFRGAIHDLTVSLNARSSISEQDASATRVFLLSVPQLKTEEQFVKAIGRYTAAQERIAKIRKDNPIPPFPDGKCR